jgi:hypothetical protein
MLRKLCLPLILAISASAFHPAISGGATSPEMGTASQVFQASVNRENAINGTTIFSEDILETGPNGVMRVAFKDSQVYLSSGTAVVVHRNEEGFALDLSRGVAVVSAAEARGFQVQVDGATIRPSGKHSTSAQIIWVSPQEFLLRSNHGDLEIVLGNDKKTVDSGLSYRVSIVPNDVASIDDPPPGAEPPAGKMPPGRKINLSKIIFGAAVIGATVGVVHVFVSPPFP